jgi:hypothetical protein
MFFFSINMAVNISKTISTWKGRNNENEQPLKLFISCDNPFNVAFAEIALPHPSHRKRQGRYLPQRSGKT